MSRVAIVGRAGRKTLAELARAVGLHDRRVRVLPDLCLRAHPADISSRFEAAAGVRSFLAPVYSPYVLDCFDAADVWCIHWQAGTVSAARLSTHPDYERWTDELSVGEFWSSVGEAWVEAQPEAEGLEAVLVALEAAAPTPQELALIDAIERKARELGVWWDPGGSPFDSPRSREGWRIWHAEHGYRVASPGADLSAFCVDALTAAAALMLIEAGHTVRVLLDAIKPLVHYGVGFSGGSREDATAEAHAHAASIGAIAEIKSVRAHRDGWHASTEIHFVQAHREGREDLALCAHALHPEDPLGAVLTLWLRGALREGHVLGVESLAGVELAGMLNERGMVPSHDLGWETSACYCLDGVWQPVGLAVRPTIEARPS